MSGVQDLSWTSNCPQSKIYLGRLIVLSPRFILDVYLFTIGFFEMIFFMNIYSTARRLDMIRR
jgi:hypothetical protein